ncbi:MAG: hypothetical protein U0572_10280 [Phycisphaerales bacterium]
MKHVQLQPRVARRGRSVIDVIVGVACIGVIMTVAVPLVAHVGTSSGEAISLNNLRVIGGATDGYAANWTNRQPTWIPDNYGAAGGDCATYLTTIGCPQPMLLGSDPQGGQWIYGWGNSGFCASSGQNGGCENAEAMVPLTFTTTPASFGSFRLLNTRALNTFVDGRFYSDRFYSPNDGVSYGQSAFYRDNGYDFANVAGHPIRRSSYCLSPAAMLHPTVLSNAFGGWRAPGSFADGFKSPSVTQCVYPDQKTRVIEHSWTYHAPGTHNPIFSTLEPWYFNSSAGAQPLAVFFDGHATRLSNSEAVADDEALFRSSGQRLWSRATPLGPGGYLEIAKADDGPRTSHTILTTDGIAGRDVLGAR